MKPAILKDRTLKDLAQLAKQKGVPGWHEMRKDQLVRVLARLAKAKREKAKLVSRPTASKISTASKITANGHKVSANGKSPSHKSNGYKSNGHRPQGAKIVAKPTVVAKAVVVSKAVAVAKTKPSIVEPKSNGFKSNGFRSNALQNDGHKSNGVAAKLPLRRAVEKIVPPKPKNPVVVERIQKVNTNREHLKDLAHHENLKQSTGPRKDRIVLLVRDPYWLHACWELTRNSIQRAKAAMAEHWHTARPVLRLLEVGDGATTSSAERVSRDIEIHGGVQNWYIDVQDPPQHYRVAIGYLAPGGKFFAICKSNSITTPAPGSGESVDKNWSVVAENYEKVYALSGGYTDEAASGELQEMFEERLRRPMGAPIVARYGVGAERLLNRQREFRFNVQAELVIYGETKADAYVTLAGEPVKVRPDGTFSVRLGMPDKRQVLPVVASSGDGIEQRTVVIAVERNTKVMEPMIRDGNE